MPSHLAIPYALTTILLLLTPLSHALPSPNPNPRPKPIPNSANPTLSDEYNSLVRLSTNPSYTYNTTSTTPSITPIPTSWPSDCESAIRGPFCQTLFPSTAPLNPAKWTWFTTGSCQIGYYWPVGLTVNFAPYSTRGNVTAVGYCETMVANLAEDVSLEHEIAAPPCETPADGPTCDILPPLPPLVSNRATNNVNVDVANGAGFPDPKTGAGGVAMVGDDVSWVVQGVPR